MIPLRRPVIGLVLPTLALMMGCQNQQLSVTTAGLGPDTVDHALAVHSAYQWCDDPDDASTCVLQLYGHDDVFQGEGHFFTLYLSPTVGHQDFSTLPSGYDALVYAHTDDVEGIAPNFDWSCGFEDGEATLDATPTHLEKLTGNFSLRTTCKDAVGEETLTDIQITGAFNLWVYGEI